MVRQTPPETAPEVEARAETGRQAALEAPRRADADQPTHQQAQVEATRGHEHPFQNVGMSPQMPPAHRARFIERRKGPFQAFAPVAQEALAPGPRIRRRLR